MWLPQPRAKIARASKGNLWRSPAHRKWVRSLQCAVRGCNATRIECAHVRNSDLTPSDEKGGTGIKPGDNWTIPLCAAHHAEQTHDGEMAFEERHVINMGEMALALMCKSPYVRAYHAFRRKVKGTS